MVLLKLSMLNKTSHTHPYTLVWNETAGFNSIFGNFLPISYDIVENSKEIRVVEDNWLPTTIKGWRLLGVDQNSSTTSQDMFWSKYNGYGQKHQLIRSTFERNTSIPYSQGVVPYNSTIWYKGREIPLPAPFLGFMNCTWSQFNNYEDFTDKPPDCLCYKGEPLLQDFRVDSHKVCTGGAEYIWGFSNFLTRVGLILELMWCIVCSYLWLYSVTHSTIGLHSRPAIGALRNTLDLAEVVKEELGENTCLYTNKQLMKALSGSDPIGYTTKERSNGVIHLGLASVPVKDGGVGRRRVRLDRDRLYG